MILFDYPIEFYLNRAVSKTISKTWILPSAKPDEAWISRPGEAGAYVVDLEGKHLRGEHAVAC